MSKRSSSLELIPDPLPRTFFARDTVAVARELTGCRLVRHWPDTNRTHTFIIVETEAYTQDDPACHAYKRTTGRAAMLYEPPGTAYVYLIYGMYHCLNVVTEPEGTAGAVLFRALEIPEGTDFRTHGPGRLTKSLDITRDRHNGIDLCDPASELYLSPAREPVADGDIIATTRIGITRATDYPWRFCLRNHPHVSVKPGKAR